MKGKKKTNDDESLPFFKWLAVLLCRGEAIESSSISSIWDLVSTTTMRNLSKYIMKRCRIIVKSRRNTIQWNEDRL
jgi:hypothetical protein